eukprot:6186823-Pleurochrysis_carterae.AAC.2
MDSSSASVLKVRSPGVYRANLSARARATRASKRDCASASKRDRASALFKRSPSLTAVEDSTVFRGVGPSVAAPHCC